MFNYSGKSMWPLCYSIMAFPPSLRDKPHIGMSDAMLCTYMILFHVHVITSYFMYMLFYVILCTCYYMLFHVHFVHVITSYFMYMSYLGMHVASFDDGSEASLKMLAEELLDLWRNPITVNGYKHIVVLGQILMDDKGRESFCGVQGGTAGAGCNICHFEGRTFKRRQVYDGIRRYLNRNDATRKKDSTKNTRNNYDFSFDELRPPPIKRTYEDYKESAAIAEYENRDKGPLSKNLFHHRGVKKLWCLDILPYAKHIHWTVDMMHCWNNVIHDMVNSLRPSQSGDKILYKHKNRTTTASVIAACEEENIHHHLLENTNPAWIFTKPECVSADAAMLKIIGRSIYEERPLHVMRAGKAKNSHDSILWAMTYARWCLRDKGCQVYTDNMCEVFDILSMLNSGRLKGNDVSDVLKPSLIAACVARAGILPPSECRITLHELLHICDQVSEMGAPRMSSLYKFERMNHILKSLLKNSAKGPFILFHVHVKTCYFMYMLKHAILCTCHNILFHVHMFARRFAIYSKELLRA